MKEKSEFQKLKAKYPDFFAKFSSDFLEFVFSEETSQEIASICLENGIKDDEIIEKIAFRVTLVLFNQLQKDNLAKILEKGVGLNPVIAEKIVFEAEKHIFSQAPGSRPAKTSLTEPENISIPDVKSETEPETKPQEKGKDTYREPIE